MSIPQKKSVLLSYITLLYYSLKECFLQFSVFNWFLEAANILDEIEIGSGCQKFRNSEDRESTQA